MLRQIIRPAIVLSLALFLPVLAGCQSSFKPLPVAQASPGTPAPVLPPSNYELADSGAVFVWRDLNTGETVDEHVGDHVGRMMQSKFGARRSFAYVPDPWADNENTKAADIEPIFPLEVGKKVTFNRQPGAGPTADSVEVLRTEALTLPFGTVDTYVIETHSRLISGGWHGVATVWYAPALHWQVQWVITDNEGDNRRRQVIAVNHP